MVIYFSTMQAVNGGIHQFLRAVNLKDGKDFGPGTVEITASVQATGGEASTEGSRSTQPFRISAPD